MSNSDKISPIALALEKSVIPWALERGSSMLFFARSSHREAVLLDTPIPTGASIEPRPWKQKEYIKRPHLRAYGSYSVSEKIWPADGLVAIRTPKLCFVLAGAIIFPIADYIFHGKPGHGILLPPGIPFSDGKESFLDKQIAGNRQCKILQIVPLTSGAVVCWITQHREEKGMLYKEDFTSSFLHSTVTMQLNMLVEEGEVRDNFHVAAGSGILRVLLIRLLRELRTQPVLPSGSKGGPIAFETDLLHSHPVVQAQEYILNNISQPLTIKSVAQHVCMSRTTFTQQFRKRTGKSFAEYVIDCRFEQAQMILRETALAVEQVGPSVGISAAHLRLLFRQRLGISPTIYRKQNREADAVLASPV